MDAHVAERTKSPVLRINLGEKDGEELLWQWRILQQDNIAGIHRSHVERAAGPEKFVDEVAQARVTLDR